MLTTFRFWLVHWEGQEFEKSLLFKKTTDHTKSEIYLFALNSFKKGKKKTFKQNITSILSNLPRIAAINGFPPWTPHGQAFEDRNDMISISIK